jgi:hypothetical protein
VSSKPPAPVRLEVDPLVAALKQLSARAQSPRAAAWAEALLSRGEAAAGRVGQAGVVRTEILGVGERTTSEAVRSAYHTGLDGVVHLPDGLPGAGGEV